MAQPLAPQNPLAEVAALFGKDGLAHKDLNNLTYTIDELVKTLEKRAGKDTSDKKSKKDQDEPRTLKSDVLGFGRGMKDALFTDPKNYLMGKSSLPAAVEKIEPVLNDEELPIPAAVEKIEPVLNDKELTIPEPNQMQAEVKEEVKSVEKINEPVPPTDDTNKVLSDMVGVLIDMRDDKSQLQLLNEAVAIKKILTEQNKKTELPGGVEPNSDEAKQEDRERLAEAIARRLGEVMGELGGGMPFMPVKPPTPTSSTPAAVAAATALTAATMGTVGAGGVAASYAATGMLAAQEEHRKAYSKEEDKSGMLSALSGDTGIAATILDANAGRSAEDINKEQATEREQLKDAPWYTKLYGIGKEDYLKTLKPKQEFPNKMKDESKILGMKRSDGATLEHIGGNDGMPDVWKKIEPKTTDNIGNVLNAVSDQNTELKMFNMRSEQPQMMAPIISNKTINNTEQTIIGTPPTPHSTTNSFLRWQQSRSGFTDSLR